MSLSIVFSGSGFRWYTFVGAWCRLASHFKGEGIQISGIGGTSGGSILAALVASGLSPDEILGATNSLPLPIWLLDPSPWSLAFKGGLLNGAKIEKELAKVFPSHLSELQVHTKIVATNLSQKREAVFDSTLSDFSVSKAVRASISIPGLFVQVKIGSDYYIDGGVSSNFAVDMFPGKVLAIRMSDPPGREKLSGFGSIFGVLNGTVSTFVESNMHEDIQDAQDCRILSLQTPSSGTHFPWTRKTIDHMISDGYWAAHDWLSKNDIAGWIKGAK